MRYINTFLIAMTIGISGAFAQQEDPQPADPSANTGAEAPADPLPDDIVIDTGEPAEESGNELLPPLEETPAEETPAEETPAEETPAEETPAEETPAEEPPAEETPAEETPAEETPAEETPAEETLAEETPAEEAPLEDLIQINSDNVDDDSPIAVESVQAQADDDYGLARPVQSMNDQLRARLSRGQERSVFTGMPEFYGTSPENGHIVVEHYTDDPEELARLQSSVPYCEFDVVHTADPALRAQIREETGMEEGDTWAFMFTKRETRFNSEINAQVDTTVVVVYDEGHVVDGRLVNSFDTSWLVYLKVTHTPIKIAADHGMDANGNDIQE